MVGDNRTPSSPWWGLPRLGCTVAPLILDSLGWTEAFFPSTIIVLVDLPHSVPRYLARSVCDIFGAPSFQLQTYVPWLIPILIGNQHVSVSGAPSIRNYPSTYGVVVVDKLRGQPVAHLWVDTKKWGFLTLTKGLKKSL